jgi:hypothetical protein
MDTSLTQLERRLTQLEGELAQTRKQLHRTGQGASRILWGWRALGAASVAMLVMGLTIASASSKPGTLTVKAPFRVLDASGQAVMVVTDNGIIFAHGNTPYMTASKSALDFFHDAKPAVSLVSDAQGGKVQVYGTTAASNSYFGYNAGVAGPHLRLQSAQQHVDLGSLSDAMGMRFYLGGRETLGFGQLDSGVSRMSFFRSSGTRALALGIGGGDEGFLNILSPSGNGVVALDEHSNGGYFAVGNTAGTARAEAGVLDGDIGVVRAYGPGGFNFIEGRN